MIFAWMNDVNTYGNYANYTAYSFHPSSAPAMLKRTDSNGVGFGKTGYTYPPTDNWGVYAKKGLSDDVKTRYTIIGKPDSVDVVSPKRVYQVGEAFDYTQGKLLVRFASSEIEVDLDNPNVEITGFNTATAADARTVTVSYMGASVSYTIRVNGLVGSGNVASGNIKSKNLKVDFESATVKTDVVETDYGNRRVVAAKNNYTNKTYNVNTYSTASYLPTIGTDSTKYLALGRYCAFEYNMPTAITASNQLLYVDFQLGRVTSKYEGGFDIDFLDSNGKQLFSLNFTPTKDKNITVTGDQVYTSQFPVDSSWRYIRAIINMDSKMVELYQGASLGSGMSPFSSSAVSFAFADKTASNLAMITNRSSMHVASVNFDNIDIYTAKRDDGIPLDVTGASISGAQTQYTMGDELNRSVGNFVLHYSDGTAEYIPLSSEDITITGFVTNRQGNQTLTATYEGYTATYVVNLKYNNYVTKITAEDFVNKYYVGSPFCYYGTLKAYYLDDTTKSIAFDDPEVTQEGFESSTIGRKAVTLKYGDVTTRFGVEVVDDFGVTASSVSAFGYKTQYYMGEEFEKQDGGLVVNLSNGTKGFVSFNDSRVKVTGFNMDKEGDQTLTATFGGKSCTFKVNVKFALYVKSATVEGAKTEYTVGSNFDTLTGHMKLVYSNNTTEEIPLYDQLISISGFNSKVAGKQTVTVTYKTESASFEVNVSKVLNNINVYDYKTLYEVGERFAYSKGYIVAEYNDNTSEKLTLYDEKVQIGRFSTESTGTVSFLIVVTSGGTSKRVNASATVVTSSKAYKVDIGTPTYSGKKITGTATVTTTKTRSGTGYLVLTAVDTNGDMKAVKIISVDLSKSSKSYSFTLEDNESLQGTLIKAFLWDSKFIPIANALE
jgi:hypothetical protein